MAEFKAGTRVAMSDGQLGHVEENDEFGYTGVRCLTPNNEPSCVVSWCVAEDLTEVPNHVVPMQKNAVWWEESRAFCGAIEAALREEGL